jgi:hypothetical protein
MRNSSPIIQSPPATGKLLQRLVSIRQHTSAYVSIRQHTSAYVSIRRRASSCSATSSAYVSIRQHTSACVYNCCQRRHRGATSTGQHTSAYVRTYVSIRAYIYLLSGRGTNSRLKSPAKSTLVLVTRLTYTSSLRPRTPVA